MKKQQKPLMLAYIIFLLVAILCHIVALFFKIEFRAWGSIVIAATIASYFFSVGSVFNCLAKQKEKYKELLNRYLTSSKRLEQKERRMSLKKNNKEMLLKNREDITKKIIRFQNLLYKHIVKYEKLTFIFDVGGYLSFFCIFCFDTVRDVFYPMQDVFTLAAFVLLLVVGYIETIITTKYEEIFNVLIESVEISTRKLEEKDNG